MQDANGVTLQRHPEEAGALSAVAAATFEGEFSEVTRSYAGKGVVRYAW